MNLVATLRKVKITGYCVIDHSKEIKKSSNSIFVSKDLR